MEAEFLISTIYGQTIKRKLDDIHIVLGVKLSADHDGEVRFQNQAFVLQ